MKMEIIVVVRFKTKTLNFDFFICCEKYLKKLKMFAVKNLNTFGCSIATVEITTLTKSTNAATAEKASTIHST